MNAEAQAWSVATFEPDDDAVGAGGSARAVSAATARTERPLRTVSRRSRPEHRAAAIERESLGVEPGADVSWNVLAHELVPFPRPAKRIFLEEADRSRQYGEAWLERELVAIRYRADAGYPALDRRAPGANPSAGAAQQDSRRSAAGNLQTAGGFVRSDSQRRALAAREATPTRTGAAADPRGWRRLLPGVATLAAIAGLWAGVGGLAAGQQPPLAVIPGSFKTHAGYLYVVRPGDTLWSIATRLQPGGDPRALVAKLESQVGGGTLVPGSRLVLP